MFNQTEINVTYLLTMNFTLKMINLCTLVVSVYDEPT